MEETPEGFSRYIGDRACYQFGAPQTYVGIWIDGFEDSHFHQGVLALTDLPDRSHPLDVWFEPDEVTQYSGTLPEPGLGKAYLIAFKGREAIRKDEGELNGFGHLGVFPRLIIADRILRIEDLGPSPE